MEKINLGDKVKDKITGFTGIAIGRTNWITGCDRIVVQPDKLNKDGQTLESHSFDEPLLIIVKRAKAKIEVKPKEKKGGFDFKIKEKDTPSKF